MAPCEAHTEMVDQLSSIEIQNMNLLNRIDSHGQGIKIIGEKMNDIESSVKEIKNHLVGTLEKKGLVRIVNEHDEYIKEQKKDTKCVATFIVRTVMLALLAYIALKIGIKPDVIAAAL